MPRSSRDKIEYAKLALEIEGRFISLGFNWKYCRPEDNLNEDISISEIPYSVLGFFSAKIASARISKKLIE